MRRRKVVALLGGAASMLSFAVRGQSQVRRIGLLMTMAETEPEAQARLASFRAGLQQLGRAEGRNIKIDYRFAAGDPERLRSAAGELVRLAPDVILANGTAILSALTRETRNIPIVFVLVPDPVGDGFVDSLARPGGNVTGLTNFEFPMGGKWVELLKEIAPRVSQVALVFNPETAPYAPKFLQFVAAGFRSGPLSCSECRRNRARRGDRRDQIEQRPDYPARPVHVGTSRAHRGAGRAIPFACDLSVSIFCRKRRPAFIRRRYAGSFSPVGIFR